MLLRGHLAFAVSVAFRMGRLAPFIKHEPTTHLPRDLAAMQTGISHPTSSSSSAVEFSYFRASTYLSVPISLSLWDQRAEIDCNSNRRVPLNFSQISHECVCLQGKVSDSVSLLKNEPCLDLLFRPAKGFDPKEREIGMYRRGEWPLSRFRVSYPR